MRLPEPLKGNQPGVLDELFWGPRGGGGVKHHEIQACYFNGNCSNCLVDVSISSICLTLFEHMFNKPCIVPAYT